VIQGTFGVIQGTFGVLQGPFGVIQGTFGVSQGTFGEIQGTFGVIQGTFGVIQGTSQAIMAPYATCFNSDFRVNWMKKNKVFKMPSRAFCSEGQNAAGRSTNRAVGLLDV
jgi:hypothetical protein